jgi:hypothetical protein
MSATHFGIVRDLARLAADATHGGYLTNARAYTEAAKGLRVYLTAAENEQATADGARLALQGVNRNRAAYNLPPLQAL